MTTAPLTASVPYDPELHPHIKSGPTGGQFAPKGKTGGQPASTAPKAAPPKKAPAKTQPAAKTTKPAAKPPAKKATPAAHGRQPVLHEGGAHNDSARVKDLQALLGELGLGKVPVDGQYGPQTRAAVMAAQRKLGLKPTGRAGSGLIRRLHDAHALSPCVPKAGSKVHAAAAYTVDDEDAVLVDELPGDEYDVQVWSDGSVSITEDGEDLVLDVPPDVMRLVQASFNPSELRVGHGEHGGEWTHDPAGALIDALDGEDATPAPKLLTTANVAEISVAAFEDVQGWGADGEGFYGPVGGRLIAISENKPRWKSGGIDEAEQVLSSERALKIADALDSLPSEIKSMPTPASTGPHDGPVFLATRDLGDGLHVSAFDDVGDDLVGANERFLQLRSDADWRDSLNGDGDTVTVNVKNATKLAALLRKLVATDVQAAVGHDVTPGHDELHHYWTRGEGLAKWVNSPTPWTTLVAHLTKYVGPEKAKVFASRWFIEVFHFAAGSDLNRVTHGHPPRGHNVGPG